MAAFKTFALYFLYMAHAQQKNPEDMTQSIQAQRIDGQDILPPTIFYTSICTNYLGKALALATSIKKSYPNSFYVIGLVERELPREFNISNHAEVDVVVLAHELMENGQFDAWVFRYSIVEAATAIKAALLRHLYLRYPSTDYFFYLDPDTYVYSPFHELHELLEKSPIVVTPHLETPGNLEMELSALRHGVFNLGFLAVRRHPETIRFIDWWAARLDYACYDDIPNGIFTDQKWINLLPCFFNTEVLREPGYNFATWSLMDRKLSRDASGTYLVNDKPLRFAHFSGFDSNMFHRCIGRWAKDNSVLLEAFAGEYAAACKAHQENIFKPIAWSYRNFLSGKGVWRNARIVWRECYGSDLRNPFLLSNIRILFSVFRRNRLKSLIRKWIQRHV
ncbi:hypothetical protein [Propionivibrio sp.]|uniref:hypothetical protein n=1 Tax=Propionivibrio sp. TaxID=2212460 RepID=UPI0039E4518B